METKPMTYQTVAESDAAEERRRRREEARENREPVSSEESGSEHKNEVGDSTADEVTVDTTARIPVWPNPLLTGEGPQPPAALKDPSWRERLDMRGRGQDLESILTESPKPTAFTLVGELPTGPTREPQTPRVRMELIEFAKRNIGKWIKYSPSKDDPFKSVDTLGGKVRKGQGGFGPHFEAAVRSKQLYVRYVGEQSE